jgi:hypothetical protein
MSEDTNKEIPGDTPVAKKSRKPGKRKRPEQCVTATRMVRKMKRSGKGNDAPGDIVFFAGATKRPNRKGGSKITTTFAAETTVINVDAAAFVDVASHAALVMLRNNILTGQKPDGSGPQVSLSQVGKADKNRLTPFRGAKSGHMADNIRRTNITGTTTKARVTILPPTDRNVFVAGEAKRNIAYISNSGEVAEAMVAAVQERIAQAAQARPANTAPLTTENADQ